MAESRTYLPLAGVIATIVLGLGAWTGRQGLVAFLIVAVDWVSSPYDATKPMAAC